MITCSRCEGFVPPALSDCPNCHTSLSARVLRKAAKAAIGAATAMTLMACYGGGWDEASDRPDDDYCNDGTSGTDADGDGYCSDVDCDDSNGSLNIDCSQDPGCVDADADGWCSDEDCNDNDASIGADCGCIDIDADGFCSTEDCDDQDPTLWHTCPNICEQSITVTGEPLPIDDTTVDGLEVTDTCGDGDVEKIYVVMVEGDPGVLQWVTADVTSDSAHHLAARDDCDSASDIACATDTPHVELLSTPGTPLWLIVEAATPEDRGPFTLTWNVQPLVCGDGDQVGPEECDDGNVDPGDGCNELCQTEGTN